MQCAKRHYSVDEVADNQPLNLPGLLAWFAGAAVALAGSEGLIASVTTVAAIDAMMVSALLYFVLAKAFDRASQREEWRLVSSMRIGLDVGGTHTDAVLMDGQQVVAHTKATTTADVGSGIETALATILEGVNPAQVELLTIGTTQFTNAVVERKHLSKVAAVRVCLPAGRGLLPRADWPADLVEATDGGNYLLHGGHLYDGRELAPVDEVEVEELLADAKGRETSGCRCLLCIFAVATGA